MCNKAGLTPNLRFTDALEQEVPTADELKSVLLHSSNVAPNSPDEDEHAD